MQPNENALQEQNKDLHHKPRNNPGDHCAMRAACCQQGGVSFETVVGIYRLTDASAQALCSEHVGYR